MLPQFNFLWCMACRPLWNAKHSLFPRTIFWVYFCYFCYLHAILKINMCKSQSWHAFNFAIRRSYERQSNAFDKYVKSAPNDLLLSVSHFHFSRIDTRQCWALKSFWNPHWYLEKKELSTYSDICLNMIHSYNLGMFGIILTDL